jgi:hypothetical protein
VIKKQRFLDWILSATENSEYALKWASLNHVNTERLKTGNAKTTQIQYDDKLGQSLRQKAFLVVKNGYFIYSYIQYKCTYYIPTNVHTVLYKTSCLNDDTFYWKKTITKITSYIGYWMLMSNLKNT